MLVTNIQRFLLPEIPLQELSKYFRANPAVD